MTRHPNNCLNGCKHTFGSPFVCFHPNYIGLDGNGVGLTEMEKEFVYRMGCASFDKNKK
jgi:hypothetical protein